jgi:glycosylphosphatidylinositol transamidase
MATIINIKFIIGLNFFIEGTNGQMPNLDLINTISWIAPIDGIPYSLHERMFHSPDDSHEPFRTYLSSLMNILYMMCNHIVGKPTGLHGVFHR